MWNGPGNQDQGSVQGTSFELLIQRQRQQHGGQQLDDQIYDGPFYSISDGLQKNFV